MISCEPTSATVTAGTNRGFNNRWEGLIASKELQLFGRLHSDLFNVPLVLLPGLSLQIRLTKKRPSFYMMSMEAASTITFKFGHPIIGVARETRPRHTFGSYCYTEYGALSHYNMTRVELKTFTFSVGSKSISIDNAVLGHVPKRLLFTMVKNADFINTIETNPYKFRHYDISDI